MNITSKYMHVDVLLSKKRITSSAGLDDDDLWFVQQCGAILGA